MSEITIQPWPLPVSATPNLPEPIPQTPVTPKRATKPATPDIVLFNEESLPIDAMSGLIFEKIGGQEIINMTRHDTVDGRNVTYQIISNNSKISDTYNPNNMISISGTLSQYFANFGIRLDTHIPESGTGPREDPEDPNSRRAYVYVDTQNPATGFLDTGMEINKNSLVIDVVNMKANEQVEVQILNDGTYLNDIIKYTEES
jgi:hypothetical protein